MTNKTPSQPKQAEPTDEQKATLAKHVSTIEKCKSDETDNFHLLADAFYQIQEQRLHLCEGYKTEAAFFKSRLNYSRSHSLRLASEGRLLNRLSPMGDKVVNLFTSDRHLRPLLKYQEGDQNAAIELAQRWMQWAGVSELTPKLMEAAVTFLHPPAVNLQPDKSEAAALAATFCDLVVEEKAKLPQQTEVTILKVFDNLAKKALALGGPRRSTGIDWTDATWNPLQGCTRASIGCDHCYAAKLVATRLADVYPGLAKKQSNGRCAFTGKIQLLPGELAAPLYDKTPKRFFVNSMSDLFHKDVREDFISAVFTVMENASWHEFQVLTKRPERMAKFTQARYKDKQPPPNVWLGTSTENQEAFDQRYPHLAKTKAAILWLSVEPLLGPIKFSRMDGIDWVVVGGESDSDRRTEKKWVTAIRDQCTKAKVPFFFKQWGGFGEDGKELEGRPKKDGLTPKATLDGVIHNAYPNPAKATATEQAAAIPERSARKSGKAIAAKA